MPSSIILWKDMYEIADKVCLQFGMTYGGIMPERKKLARYFGACWPCKKCIDAEHIDEKNCNEKILYIRLHQLDAPRRSLANKTILRTLAHELAHLKEWDHGPEHIKVESEIKEFIKELGHKV